MPKIESGEFTYSRKLNDGDYAGREFKAVIRFVVSDGETLAESWLDAARTLATDQVHKALGFGVNPQPAPAVKAGETPVGGETVRVDRRTKAGKAAAASPAKGLPEGAVGLAEAKARVAAPQTDKNGDPFSNENPITAGKLGIAPDGGAMEGWLERNGVDAGANQGTVPADPVVKAITDAELISAINRKNEEIESPTQIRALIGRYDTQHVPGSAHGIPVEKRPGFLEDLKGLTKAPTGGW